MAEREFPANNGLGETPSVVVGPQGPVQPPKEREKKVEAIEGLGPVTVKKPSLGSRFKNTFFGGDAKTTAAFVWSGVLVPMAKNAFLDAIQQGSERMVWGEVRSRPAAGTIPNLLGLGHQAYNKMYTGPMPAQGQQALLQQQQAVIQQRSNRATHNFSELVVATRAGAELVIDRMYDLLSRDGVVTVADFMDLLGEPADYTMQKYGWIDLRGSQVVRVPQGYLLDLPKPVVLD